MIVINKFKQEHDGSWTINLNAGPDDYIEGVGEALTLHQQASVIEMADKLENRGCVNAESYVVRALKGDEYARDHLRGFRE